MRPLILLAAALLLGACGSSASSDAAAAKPLFRWGGDAEGGAPFVEADPADPRVVRGFDVEIAEMIARGLGREPRFVQVAWASIGQSLERGDFEVGLSGVEDRPEMRERYALTMPYFEFQEVLAVRPADRGRYRTLADLAGRRVATLGATMAHDILLEEQKKTGLVPVSYDDDVHPYTDLVAGRVDAVLLDNVIADRSLRRTGGFVIQPEPVATGAYVGVFARQNTALRDSANAILRARMQDGSLEATFRRWDVWSDAQAAYFQRVLAEAPREDGAAASRDRSVRAYLPALARAAGVTLAPVRAGDGAGRRASGSPWRRGACTGRRSCARRWPCTWRWCAARRCCCSSSSSTTASRPSCGCRRSRRR